ncbi:MAG: hypothetical protein JST48_11870 [Bacteroidetes bacterium]|nr:hypothetical protein [Bacteroidota bacterium]
MCAGNSFSQKIDGVYYGKIVSDKNAMVVTENGSRVSGVIYLNEKDTINFSGSYLDNVLKSSVRLKDKSELTLIGHFKYNSMWLVVLPDSDQRFLNKVSRKTSYKISKLYSDHMDPMLLGRWESMRYVKPDGTVSIDNGKIASTYYDNNRMNVQILSIPRNAKKDNSITDSRLLSQRLEYYWETNGNELTEKPNSFNLNWVGKYIITKDTLIKYGNRGGYTIYKKQ